jgi:hypothetical protein
MQQPTINKQVYSWGTTKKPSASLSVEALPANYNSSANANYTELRNSNITEPYPIHNGVIPVNTETGYFQPGANLSVQSLPPMDYNVEYKQLRESNIIMPAPIVIPNFYIQALNAGNTQPDTQSEIQETITNFVDMMAIILEYKKERRLPDFDKWMSINSTYKKILLLEKQRTLTDTEINLKQELEQNILNEFEQIKVDAPVAVAADPVAVATAAISADPPPATPVDRSDTKLRATGAALLGLIATGAAILPSQLTDLVQSISLPNISVLNSMLSIPVNSGMSATLSALSSLTPSSMQILAIMLTSGSAYMMYKRGRPVVLDRINIDRQNQFFPDPGGLQNQMTSVVADPSYDNGWAIMPSESQYPIFLEHDEEKEYPDIPFSSVIPLFPLSSVGVLGENPITPIQVVNPQIQRSQLYMPEAPGMPFRDPPRRPDADEKAEEDEGKEAFINMYFQSQLKPRAGNDFYSSKKVLENILTSISNYKKGEAKKLNRGDLINAITRSLDPEKLSVIKLYKSILNGKVNANYK